MLDTYDYTIADWKDDLSRIQAKGVDAVALNIGRSEWQKTQVQLAYDAATSLGSSIKLFYSFDFTEMDCTLSDFVSRVNKYKNHPSQFKVNGKPMISSYSGDCLGNSGWASLKTQTGGYLMPFIWGLEGKFNQWSSLDSWYCWGCAWPQGNHAKTTSDDQYYINQLGSRYATTISGWMYTHFSYKNFYQRGDDWLIVSRWEQLMSMRNTLTFVEMVTWNDWGESDYFGPVKGAQPDGTTWASNFPHTAWYDLSEYYITAFKTGSYPAITKDVIYFWARPHPARATASGDSIGKPTGWDWTEDSMWAVVFATSSGTVTLSCGSSSNTFSVNAGVTKLKIPLSQGKMAVQMKRNGQTIINYSPSDYTYALTPVLYNYNAWVGSATATGGNAPPTSSSTTSSSSTSASSTTTSTSATTTASPTPTQGFQYVGCYKDDSSRVISNGPFTDSAQTVAKCLTRCAGYAYAGVEYGVECFCGASLRSDAEIASESECSMPCAGKNDEKCGNGHRINVYKAVSTASTTTTTSTSTSTTTSASATATSWSSYGCVAEGTTGSRRALTGPSYSQSNMTPTICQSLCSGYQYAGVEYSRECYCGNSLTDNGATGTTIPSSNCQSTCAGDASQKCGGSWSMNVYSKSTSTPPSASSWTSAGCYIDASTRMLRGYATSQTGLTTETCINICSTAGFTMAATEYGRECYCGSQLLKEDGGGVSIAASQCNMPCEGNSAQTCGAGWRGNLYLKPGTTI
ncbi:unnamed protein product [Cyclocybe aegerita]|uniref:WSC domain-containing protein n=1 Tax=Cyclocybe aegerita TaxID=1973307 RepID=A0A8S0VUD4_CYCAE|nr:unnamed protein product [Cyclocybe aegerita]